MLYYKINDDINKKIYDIYAECEIRSFPVDCTSILMHYGFKVFTYSELKEKNPRLYELSCSYSSDSFKYGDVIAYNDKNSHRRIRFSLMHELGHLLLQHSGETAENEAEADLFASCILAPRIAIHNMQCRDADALHDTFGLSYGASNRALADYHNWYQSICRTTRKPSAPEQQLERLLFPADAGQRPHPPKDDARSTGKQPKSEERTRFFKEMHQKHGDSFSFAHAEHQFLYGNDL